MSFEQPHDSTVIFIKPSTAAKPPEIVKALLGCIDTGTDTHGGDAHTGASKDSCHKCKK